MPGSKPYGFHEGSRSEYLAQYIFASWGTAVVIPQQEDHGLDLHCTLMDRVGGRLLAKSPYTVQVKSTWDPIVFDSREAVRWVIEHPLPLFICIVDKPTARISVYHTLARFHAWSIGQWPDRLAMIPEPRVEGKDGGAINWPGTYDLSLDQPILDYSVTELLEESNWQNAREVIEHWVKVENDNIRHVRNGLLTCRAPSPYRTNSTWVGGWAWVSSGYPTDEQYQQHTDGLKDSLDWLAYQALRRKDLEGAAKTAMLHRHLFPNDHSGLPFVLPSLNGLLNKNDYVYAAVDHLAAVVKGILQPEALTVKLEEKALVNRTDAQSAE